MNYPLIIVFIFCAANRGLSYSCNVVDRSKSFLLTCSKKQRFVLYDVNFGEGFNLRRDVYMRVASLVRDLNSERPYDSWTLVLPPWGPLYHWQGDVQFQKNIPWSSFFDLQSLFKYVPILEFQEFIKQHGSEIDMLYYLQHPPQLMESSHWQETVEESKCSDQPPYKRMNQKVCGWFWGFDHVFSKNITCLSMLGGSSTLKPMLLNSKFRVVMFDRAEVILHNAFGDAEYWAVRRSMVFSKRLQAIGNKFRENYLNSTDKGDRTEKRNDWALDIHKARSALGGPYIAVHLRRRDFIRARPLQVPGIYSAAQQIKSKLTELNLNAVFVSTDAHPSEFHELKAYIPSAVQFKPNKTVYREIKDGGVAIVDQWICAHARYFIGTHESTFSFRIQEEREILGFPELSTFNRFCGDNEVSCKQPTQWKIAYV